MGKIVVRNSAQNLTVLEEIKKALFPLREEELAALESSVLAEGIRDPLVVWPKDGKLILVDGHYRYQLAQKHGLPFKVVERNFANLEEALAWVDQNQLARRNLTDEQRRYLLGRIYERQKKAPIGFKDRNLSGGKIYHGSAATAKAIAKLAGVSEKTVRNSAEFAKAVDAVKRISPETAERILKGEVKDAITALPQVFRSPDLFQIVAEKIAQGESSIRKAKVEAKREIAGKRQRARELPDASPEYTLVVADVRDLPKHLKPNSVDAIITDPPYGKEYLDLYDALAEAAQKVLKQGGNCVVMTGQAYLGEIIVRMSKHLSYQWTLAYLTPGPSVQVFGRHVKSNWKPVLWFVKGENSWEHVDDVVRSDRPEKTHHEWGQSVAGMAELVLRFSAKGHLIVDPFVGGGATGEAALRLSRRFWGSDVDPDAVKRTESRLRGLT